MTLTTSGVNHQFVTYTNDMPPPTGGCAVGAIAAYRLSHLMDRG
jgi:hypothetical protein